MRVLHRKHGLGIVALAALALALPQGAAQAQNPQPQATIQAANGEDYAASELGNPWDMSGPEDIAYEFTRDRGQITNLGFENGQLKGTTGGDARVTLLVPSNAGVNPVLPEGGYRPINTAKYRYLTVKMTVDKTSFANVYWQATDGSSFNGYVETSGQGFKTFNPGTSVITFDLGASSKWTGTVQGLYFDPATTSGVNFQLDYVLLTTTPPTNPNNTPLEVAITAPSFISGPDYATTELANPWDMNDASDVERFFNVTNATFNNGILRAVNTTNDPAIALNVPGTINTSKYKYVTYRMSVDGNIDTVNGSVARFVWWSDIPQNSTTTRDTVVYEGYRTVSFDMNTIRTEPNAGANRPWSQSAPTVFRLDPHEFPAAHAFNVDYVMLTGDSVANTSYNIRYTVSNNASNVQFFYDTDRNADNGTTAISCGAARTQAANSRAYIPLVTAGAAPPVVPGGSTCRWNTASVPNGSYYVYMVVNDGSNTVARYSDTPVVVQH